MIKLDEIELLEEFDRALFEGFDIELLNAAGWEIRIINGEEEWIKSTKRVKNAMMSFKIVLERIVTILKM